MGAVDLILLQVLLSAGIAGTLDTPLSIALILLICSLPLTAMSLFFSFLKQKYNIPTYGKIHGYFSFFALVTGTLSLDGAIWHISRVDESGNLVVPVIRYLKYLDSIGHARNTLRSYAFGLALFFTYLIQQNLDYQQVTLDDLAGFVLWLKNPYHSLKVLPAQPVMQARTNTTINQIITAVAGFYEYLWRQDDLATNVNERTRTYLPAHTRSYKSFLHHLSKGQLVEKNLLKQRVPKRRPKTLPKEQIEALVKACENIRDKLLVTLLYESSLRIGECLALWIEDVDVSRCQLHVRDRGQLPNDAEIKTTNDS